jgi:hypothetical protein
MTTIRTYVGLNSLVLGAIGVSAIATVVLIALPGNLVAWQIGSWTLVFALLGLLALVLPDESKNSRRPTDKAIALLERLSQGAS